MVIANKRIPLYYHFTEFSTLSFDDVTVDDVTVARDMFTKRMVTRILFQHLKNSSSINIFDRHIFNVFMKYSALISLQNMLFNDEIYNRSNGGRPYFDFG